MGVTEVLQAWQDMGIFEYVITFVLSYLIFFCIIFFLLNKRRFLEKERPLKFLVNVLISGFISVILAGFINSSLIIRSLFRRLFIIDLSSFNLVVICIISILSILLWILAIIDVVRRNEGKLLWVLGMILGGLGSGFGYFIQKRFKAIKDK